MTQPSKTSLAMKAMWADPLKRAAFMASRASSPGYASPERGRKIAAKAKLRWADPAFRERARASMSAAQKGRKGSPHSRPVRIAGMDYPSIIEASRQLGKSRPWVVKRNELQA